MNAAEYAKYNGTLTREDYMNRDTGESGFIDGVQAYLTREIAPVKALWQNIGDVDAAKKQMEVEAETDNIKSTSQSPTILT